ncbi:BNR-4 repeat-containing protein [Olivibacter sp. CPCC 100613]|uniref:BNR-4 repeat-containing protein n=1 Tax=Olivibacter sp. CPCC 100613 TaxID=3079931 RepID=UPI002FF50DAB
MKKYNGLLITILTSFFFSFSDPISAQTKTHPDLQYAEATLLQQKANGFKGIWYMNQPSNDEYVYKYSGGMATYPANHRPFAIYAPEANKTFFCFGGSDDRSGTLYHNVSYYDHKKKKLANPTIILDKKTTDAHDNPVISIDDEGYIWIFSTSHGRSRPSYIVKSKKPYQINQFDTIRATEQANGKIKAFDNFSYFQVYHLPQKGFIALFTKYNEKGQRVIGFNTSRDGHSWGQWQVLAHIEEGHYQISTERDGKIGVAFDYHPKGKGLNYRTNLYYLETSDFGKTWTTASGTPVTLPLQQKQNAALVHDYSAEHLNSYLLDIDFDAHGKPYILTITSKGYEAGPRNAPRNWTLSTYDGQDWISNIITQSDSNYDMGSIYLDQENIAVIGPTIDGPQAFNPGGEIAIWNSTDKGRSWKKEKQVTAHSAMNHSYVRKPRYAQSDFYAIWADGNARKPSISHLYYMDKKGTVYQMPYTFKKKLIKATPLN